MEITEIHPEMPSSERKIVLKIIQDALAAGYQISVYDGGEYVLHKSTDEKAIFAVMYSTGSDMLCFYQGNQIRHIGWVSLIYGNGYDVIHDYSDNDRMEKLLGNFS